MGLRQTKTFQDWVTAEQACDLALGVYKDKRRIADGLRRRVKKMMDQEQCQDFTTHCCFTRGEQTDQNGGD